MEPNSLKKLSKKILFAQAIIFALCSIAFYPLIPIFLNYPPNSINTEFQLSILPAQYVFYYAVVLIVAIFLYFFITLIMLRQLAKLGNNSKGTETLIRIRKLCYNFHVKILLLFPCIPSLAALIILPILSTNITLTVKISLLIFLLISIPCIIFSLFINNIFKSFLRSTYNEDIFKKEKLKKSHITTSFFYQILPSTLVVIFAILFLANYMSTQEISNLKSTIYNQKIDNIISDLEANVTDLSNINDITNFLNNNYSSENWFMVKDYECISSNNVEISNFMLQYMKFYAEETNGRIYDDYGITYEAMVKAIPNTNSEYYIGLKYSTASPVFSVFLFIGAIIMFLLDIVVIYMFAKNISSNIEQVSNSLYDLAKSDSIKTTLLPVTTTDEIGRLTQAFNMVQEKNAYHIEQIRNNQDLLIEKERLASLGQMIGGIAHNLKTPIMSIGGAAEGLQDLVNEYDNSIDDPEVNSKDHHEIAKDMYTWISKIKTHTSYMSDVITAVKGQAVALSGDDVETFTIEELIKRVNILMRHELKSAVINLNYIINVKSNLELKGDVNSLVQVINNMISNSIQAYDSKKNENIDLIIDKYNSNLVISIKDYGPGLPENVKNKLFKEMITTKGKNGTGLGLFMSYSTIKGHFNGNITFESEPGRGTKFNIIIPL